MKSEELRVLVQSNIEALFEQESYKNYLIQSGYTCGYDFINKFLIYFQNKHSTEVKSDLDWREHGRIVLSTANPIWILMPIYKTAYRDVETCKLIKSEDLSILEIQQALEYGLIAKEKYLIKMSTSQVYDIADTKVIQEGSKDEANKQIKLSSLYSMCSDTCNMKVSISSGVTHYDQKTNHLVIGNDTIENKVSTIVNCIATYLVNVRISKIETYANDDVDKHLENLTNISEVNRRFMAQSIAYAVLARFGIRAEIEDEFKGIEDIYKWFSSSDINIEQLYDVMDSIENIKDFMIESVIKTHRISSEAADKAEKFLNVLEANAAMQMIKSGI